jgi:hypothetical protein
MSLSAHYIGQSGMLGWLAILVVASLQFLVALWAATSSRSRFIRAMVVWVAVVALMPIGAYAPALVFTLNAALTAGLVAAIRHVQRIKSPQSVPHVAYRFHLADIFVAILCIATLLALAKQFTVFHPLSYLFLTLQVAPLPMIIAFSHHAMAGPWRRQMAIATIVMILVSAAYLQNTDAAQLSPIPVPRHISSDERHEVFTHTLLLGCLIACVALPAWCWGTRSSAKTLRPWQRAAKLLALAIAIGIGLLLAWDGVGLILVSSDRIVPRFAWMVIHATPFAALALLVVTATWLSRIYQENQNTRWGETLKATFLIYATVIAIPLGWLYGQMLWRTPFPPPPTSPTNHYERIVAISRELKLTWSYSVNKLPTGHQPLVDEAVELLMAPNYVPTAALEAESINSHAGLLGHDMKAFYGYLFAAIQVAEDKREFDRGADYAIAGLRFATMLERGGTSEFVSSFGRGSLKWLAEHREQVSTAKARDVGQILDSSLAEREDFTVLYARALVFAERSSGWPGRLASILANSGRAEWHATAQREAYWFSELSMRSVQTLYAIRLFRSDHGRLPSALDELTPTYISALPLDPFSKRPIIYRPSEETFALYSIGRDRKDDGGKFNHAEYYRQVGYDLDLSWGSTP